MQQLDYQSKLTKQLPIIPLRVVYNCSGMHVVAAKITNCRALIASGLYWAAVHSENEANYLCAIVNTPATTDLVRPLMSYGKDERHIHKHIFEVPIRVCPALTLRQLAFDHNSLNEPRRAKTLPQRLHACHAAPFTSGSPRCIGFGSRSDCEFSPVKTYAEKKGVHARNNPFRAMIPMQEGRTEGRARHPFLRRSRWLRKYRPTPSSGRAAQS